MGFCLLGENNITKPQLTGPAVHKSIRRWSGPSIMIQYDGVGSCVISVIYQKLCQREKFRAVTLKWFRRLFIAVNFSLPLWFGRRPQHKLKWPWRCVCACTRASNLAILFRQIWDMLLILLKLTKSHLGGCHQKQIWFINKYIYVFFIYLLFM